jgi:glycosyltransferase involved in cell wall biosynthesis/tetratricopeptide (TPR) repeat protein
MSDLGAVPVRSTEHEQALQLYREGRYEGSARVLAGLLKTKENSELWNDWATTQLMLGKRAESEEGYRRALELDPQSYQAAGNLGVLLATSGRVPEALPLLERAASGSTGAEREQLLRLIQTYRSPNRSDGQSSSDRPLLLQMATVIHQQSQAIASLIGRVSALEAGFDRQAVTPPQSAGGIGRTTGAAAQRTISNTKRTTPQHDGVIGDSPRPTAMENADCASRQDAPQPGVYFGGQVCAESEYAEGVRAAALRLAEHGLPVQLARHQRSDSGSLISENSRTGLESLERRLVDIPKSVIFQSGPPSSWNLDWAGRVRVGRSMFGADGLPEVFRDACKTMDEVWVPSRFNLETFAKGGVNKHKLRLLPGGVDTGTYRPDVPAWELKPKRSFNFLSVFDWHLLKGYDVLLGAYLREFTSDDDVGLILNVGGSLTDTCEVEAQITYFIERKIGIPMEKCAAIILLNGATPQSEIAGLYAAADAFVLPSRGEGCGRSYLEAMACRLPVIATNWGGQLDFLNGEDSYLIESQLTPVPSNVEIEYYRGQRWAEPSIEHLRQLMREVYSHPDEGLKKAERVREDVLHSYDWTVVMPRWVAEFERLLN